MNIVLPFRFTFFGIFVICNAIICSAAAWNLGIAQMISRRMDIDGYLIFLGALDLAFVVVISVIDLTRRNALTSRVWFECSWLGVLLALHISGAAVLTATGSNIMCDSASMQIPDACTSIRLTLATSWICVTSLLIYFFTLVLFACLCYRDDRSVWQATVRDYPWDGCCKQLPNSATFPLPPPKPASIKAPQPRRLALPALYSQRHRLSTDYESQTFPPSHHMQQAARVAIQPPPPSLYPRHLQPYASRYQPPPPPLAEDRSTTETPPPLGSWPRANIVNEPVHKKSRPPATPRAVPEPVPRPNPRSIYVPPRASRPSGPRATAPRPPKKPSGDWRSRVVVPPPLDLSKISTNRPSTR